MIRGRALRGKSLPKFAIKFGLIAGMVGLTPAVHAADADAIFAPALSAQIFGEVRNSTGVVQMGAVVSLYNRYDELLRTGLSNQDGKFVFDGLAPNVYSIRVSLASFVPALRRNISVLSGSENLLKIQLASALSTIELIPISSPEGALMSDSWKWVLRSSHATRPVLRLVPQTSSSRSSMASLFSDTSGLVKVSAGDGDPFGASQDLGTAFVLATSLNGSSKVRVSGNVGYAASGFPSAGLRATYRRDDQTGEGPQLALTVRQIYLPSLMGSGALGSNTAALRTASISSFDQMDILDVIHLEYGASLESISLFGRMNHVNPFARATYDLGNKSAVRLAVSSGSQPVELLTGGPQQNLNGDLAALGQMQRISRRDGRAAVERNKVIEAGYQTARGSRTYRASVYAEEVTDAAFLMSGDSGFVDAGNLLPDLSSRGTVFDLGDYHRMGYSASVTQALGDRVEVSVAAGHTDALQLQTSSDVLPASGDGVRSGVRNAPRPWATVEADGSLPVTRTYLATSYGWTDPNVLMPIHVSLTGKSDQTVGWNIVARQPLPSIGGMHMEITADLRNLLAQGYVGIQSNGRHAVLTNAPRAVRGGVSFIF
jgi:Carboxypeptidase regulatory-like domain